MVEYTLYRGNCLDIMQRLIDNGTRVHSIVTDPPYHFASIVSRFGKEGSAPTIDTGVYRRSSKGFMGKDWDGGDIAFNKETWLLCNNLLLPGGHLLSFSATKNYHRMACAIEDTGFEIRDQMGWIYGTGFPKSHTIGEGWKTALKPAWEPICVARKPISTKTIAQNFTEHGVGGFNIDGCRVNDKFPSNILHDGSEDVIAAFPGKTSRFFYSAKASKQEKAGTEHPTVKPLSLMRYLVRLVTPKDGVVLDPFAGSGTTLEGAYMEGVNSIGIEMDTQYCADIGNRMVKCKGGLF